MTIRPRACKKRIMIEAEWKILPEAVRLYCEGRLTVDGDKVKIRR